MRKIYLLTLVLIIINAGTKLWGQNVPDTANKKSKSQYHVRADATGANDGSNWTNAYTELPDDLERGSTYYIASGTYSSYTFDDAVSGSLYITIKKATITNHGIETGWDNSYEDGEVVLGTLKFTADYFIGRTRNI